MFLAILFSIVESVSQQNITSGYMDGYFNLTQIQDIFSAIQSENLPFTQTGYIGTSTGNIQIPYLKFAQSSGVSQSSKQTLIISACFYSGYPLSATAVIYAAYYIAEHSDMLLSRNVILVPVVNVDAYSQMQQDWKAQGEFTLIQKNLRSTGCGTPDQQGVNLNRNWPYQFGFLGSEDDPCSASYAGTSSFSEVQTQALRDLMNIEQPLIWLHFDKFGEFATHPYSYKESTNFSQEGYLDAYFYQEEVHSRVDTYGNSYQNWQVLEDGTMIDYLYSQGVYSLEVSLGDDRVTQQGEIFYQVSEGEEIIDYLFSVTGMNLTLTSNVTQIECGTDSYQCISSDAFSYISYTMKMKNDGFGASSTMKVLLEFIAQENQSYIFDYSRFYVDYFNWTTNEHTTQTEALATIIQNNETYIEAEYTLTYPVYSQTLLSWIIERTNLNTSSANIGIVFSGQSYPISTTNQDLILYTSQSWEIITESDSDDGDGEDDSAIVAVIVIMVILLVIIIFVVFICVYRHKKRKEKEQRDMQYYPGQENSLQSPDLPEFDDGKPKNFQEVNRVQLKVINGVC